MVAVDVGLEQSRHATVRDMWDVEDWKEVRAEIPRLAKLEDDLRDVSWTAPRALADVHQLLTRPIPQINPNLELAYKPNGKVISELLDSEIVASMRQHTVNDAVTAGLATTRMGTRLATLFEEISDIQEQADKAQQKADEYGEACDGAGKEPGSPEAQADAALEALRQEAEAAEADLNASLGEVGPIIEKAARQAAAEGQAATNELSTAMAGWGLEKGDMGKRDAAARLALVERLTTPRMLRLSELIGRLRTEMWAMASANWTFGNEEVDDITLGDDLERVLPEELVYLAVPALRPIFYEKYATKKLMQLRLRGRAKEARGKVIFLEDASSSMLDSLGGQASIFARALAIVLLDVAIAQKRGFTGVVWASEGQMQEFDFGHDASTSTLEERLDYAEFVMSGGTEPGQALRRSLALLNEEYEETGRMTADVVMATDGVWNVDKAWLEKWNEQKAALKFRCFGLAMNFRIFPGLEAISDFAVDARSLVNGDDVGRIFQSVSEPAKEYA